MKIAIIVICGVIFLAAAVSFVIASYVFSAYIKRPKKTPDVEDWYARIEKNGRKDVADAFREKSKKLKALPYKELAIESADGLTLYAKYYDNGADTTVVLMHGMRGNPLEDMVFHFDYFYGKKKYNVLLPDQRAHGRSGGDFITYGAREKHDIARWCTLVADERGKSHKIILCGISLGATSSLLAAALDSMPKLHAVIADCGYSDMMEEFRRTIRRKTHLPALLVEPMLWKMCCRRALFDPLKVNVPQKMREVYAPVLFFHGTDDGLVSHTDTDKNAAVCRTYHETVKIDGAGHALAFAYATEKCEKATDAFFSHIALDKADAR